MNFPQVCFHGGKALDVPHAMPSPIAALMDRARPGQPTPPSEATSAPLHSQPRSQRTFLSFEDHCLQGQEVYLAV